MSKKHQFKPVRSVLGATVAATLMAAGTVAHADANPFGVSNLSSGYMVAGAEGKCGEGKCGEKKAEGKCGEGKCGEKKTEGKCGEGKCGEKKTEGKCGEGKCGGTK